MSFGKIVSHILKISHPDNSLDFYINKMGMILIAEESKAEDSKSEHHFYLSFRPKVSESSSLSEHPNTLLKLIYQNGILAKVKNEDPTRKDGYWKIGVTLEDVNLGRQSLLDLGIEVSEPRQFRDIGYLCHLADPDGHSIELLQHTFDKNEPQRKPNPEYVLKTRPTFGQITLRVKDAEKSLHFYQEGLGMRLLSRQVVDPYRFALYFLAYTNDKLPFLDIDHVGNREWLWQRPYTTLELQHNWGTEDSDFAYRVGPGTGFVGMEFGTVDLEQTIQSCCSIGSGVSDQIVYDPDGYRIQLYSHSVI